MSDNWWHDVAYQPGSEWIAQVLGDPNGTTWEISVVRESYRHGRISYGWFNEDKLLISEGHAGVWSLAPGLGPMLVEVAHRFAAYLNGQVAMPEARKIVPDGRHAPTQEETR